MEGSVKNGLSEMSKIEGGSKRPLRGETSEETQRPVAKSEKIKGDDGRGSFTCK